MDYEDMDTLSNAVYQLRGCGLLIDGLASYIGSIGSPDDRDLSSATDTIHATMEKVCKQIECVLEKGKVTPHES